MASTGQVCINSGVDLLKGHWWDSLEELQWKGLAVREKSVQIQLEQDKEQGKKLSVRKQTNNENWINSTCCGKIAFWKEKYIKQMDRFGEKNLNKTF